MTIFNKIFLLVFIMSISIISIAQKKAMVKLIKDPLENKVDVFVGGKMFTAFIFPDSLEKPVLYPIYSAEGKMVTRGYPLTYVPQESNDHPHHLGLWFNYESVNGLDFWNNSFAIAEDKKPLYGWIKTDRITQIKDGTEGILSYHANWQNQNDDILLRENTKFVFSGSGHQRIIDRTTTLIASTDVFFKDVKDGMLGLRLAHELQMPSERDQTYTDEMGNLTLIKAGEDQIANGNYLSSEGKVGNDVWGSRARWTKVYGKMGKDSVTITIIDHPQNINYPTFWHARGYGLFAANPLGEQVFTNGKSEKNLRLKKDASVTFKYRIVIDDDIKSTDTKQLNQLADDFAKK